jgi:hypothetical protein
MSRTGARDRRRTLKLGTGAVSLNGRTHPLLNRQAQKHGTSRDAYGVFDEKPLNRVARYRPPLSVRRFPRVFVDPLNCRFTTEGSPAKRQPAGQSLREESKHPISEGWGIPSPVQRPSLQSNQPH